MARGPFPPRACETPYPGKLLRDHIFPALSLSISQAARELGLSRQTLHRILDGTTPITPETAARLGSLCDVPSMYWLHLQCACDLRRAEASLATVLPMIPRRTLSPELLKQLGVIDER